MISSVLTCGLRCLTGLATDVLALVADALALVRLGLPDRTDLGGGLANELLVDAPYGDLRGRRYLELDARRRRLADRVRETDQNSRSLPCLLARYPTPCDLERFSYPWVTPGTMLASRLRTRPCRALTSRCSVVRVTRSSPSTWLTSIFSGSARWSSPLGPVDRHVASDDLTRRPPTGWGSVLVQFVTSSSSSTRRRPALRRRRGCDVLAYRS